jgi:hypothetical protein
METSHANGGQLSASNAEVWTHPSTLLKGLKWMFKADAPAAGQPHAQLAQAELVCRVHRIHPEVPRQHRRHRAWQLPRASTCSAGPGRGHGL